MKKFGIRLPILCALILLVGVTALATVTRKITMGNTDQNVTVALLSPDEPESPAIFKVTPKHAAKDKQYLLVIRKGEAPNPKDPTADVENLVYMGMERADENGRVQFSNAYPKDMDAGTYYVYLSDYGANNQLKQVATFDVAGSIKTATHSGDFDGSGGDPDIGDVVSMIDLIVNERQPTPEQLQAADFDNDDDITIGDVTVVINLIVG